MAAATAPSPVVEDFSWGWFVATDPSQGLELPSTESLAYAQALPPWATRPVVAGRSTTRARGGTGGEGAGSSPAHRAGEVEAWLSLLDDEDLGVPPQPMGDPVLAPRQQPSPSARPASRPSVAPPRAFALCSLSITSIAGLVPSSLSYLLHVLVAPFRLSSSWLDAAAPRVPFLRPLLSNLQRFKAE
eukprot:CAMPEP_0118962592 /NCGR_PEP_ID=MMETSP1173-20130426/876_1 /TAXON_ID=1034831 /ORGANISM="Rhizochromulina marina cf, Strain CCMP1243" /LENGTH=186 /DNA_ID=CAMNT_0006910877 /DNA_START=185 /DNA_END=745 /DNA_ORIENTATION=+